MNLCLPPLAPDSRPGPFLVTVSTGCGGPGRGLPLFTADLLTYNSVFLPRASKSFGVVCCSEDWAGESRVVAAVVVGEPAVLGG